MAYEISEAFYAGLSLVDTPTLNAAKNNKEKFNALYNVSKLNFDSAAVLDKGGTKRGMQDQIISMEGNNKQEALYSDLAVGISAVLGTRDIKKGTPDAVYLTGNQWHRDVQKFKIKAFGMSDYNSSDVILKYGTEFIGISLKKKPTATSASPTMINTAFSKFIDGSKLKTIQKEINDHRIKFFASVIKQATEPGKPLSNIEDKNAIGKLNPDNLAQAKKIWDMKVNVIGSNKKIKKVALINLKGASHLIDSETVANDGDEFRKYVNTSLQSQGRVVNPLFQGFLNIMNQPEIRERISDSLLNKVLKLSLFDELDTWKNFQFGFYLVEGVGTVDRNLNPSVGNATAINLHSVMVAVAHLAKLDSRLEVDFTKTGERKAAKVFFILYKGPHPLLDIELRYKGSFTSFPQFFATMTPEFKKLIKNNSLGIK